MPRIPDDLLNSVFYLYESEDAAKKGEKSGGCGFFLSMPYSVDILSGRRSHLYAVTNAHVIAAGGNVIRITTKYGKSEIIRTKGNDWIPDPDNDLSVYPITLDDSHLYKSASYDSLLTEDKLKEFNIGIGSDIVTIGRFITVDGKLKNAPVVRFGHIAMMPIEPIFNPSTKIDQDSFLVEGRSMGGFSGSVISAVTPHMYQPEHGGILGIVWGHVTDYTEVKEFNENTGQYERIEVENKPLNWFVGYNTAMMLVVPAWKIKAHLDNHEDLVMSRKKTEENDSLRADVQSSSGAVADATTPDNDEPKATLTREEFEKILKRVSRPDQPDKESSETSE